MDIGMLGYEVTNRLRPHPSGNRSFAVEIGRREPPNHKEPWATLRDEPTRIQNEGVDGVAEMIQRKHCGVEVAAPIRCKKPHDVLKQNQAGSAKPHPLQHLDEAPERRRLCTLVQSKPSAREGQIGAWKRRGRQIDVGHGSRVKFMNVGKIEMLSGIAKVPVVHLAFFGIDVVGKRQSPVRGFQAHPHQTDAGKELRKAKLGYPSP